MIIQITIIMSNVKFKMLQVFKFLKMRNKLGQINLIILDTFMPDSISVEDAFVCIFNDEGCGL